MWTGSFILFFIFRLFFSFLHNLCLLFFILHKLCLLFSILYILTPPLSAILFWSLTVPISLYRTLSDIKEKNTITMSRTKLLRRTLNGRGSELINPAHLNRCSTLPSEKDKGMDLIKYLVKWFYAIVMLFTSKYSYTEAAFNF